MVGALIKRSAFLPIASPRVVKEPPAGPDCLHEVKFDGFGSLPNPRVHSPLPRVVQ